MKNQTTFCVGGNLESTGQIVSEVEIIEHQDISNAEQLVIVQCIDIHKVSEIDLQKEYPTCFVDEMKGEQRLEHIVFRSGSLFVEREKQTLQKLLSLYHPHKDKLYEEFKPAKIAAEEIDLLENDKQVYIVEECVGSRKLEDADMGINRMLKSGASLINFEMIFFELIRDSKNQFFKKLSSKFVK